MISSFSVKPISQVPLPVVAGYPHPLGVTPSPSGVNFSLASSNATGVELLLFSAHDSLEPFQTIRFDPYVNKTFHFWHAFVRGLKPGVHYAYRVDGRSDSAGQRFNRAKPGTRFQPPPHRTQRADFPHLAHLFASCQGLWGLSYWGNFPACLNYLLFALDHRRSWQSLNKPSPFIKPLATPPLPGKPFLNFPATLPVKSPDSCASLSLAPRRSPPRSLKTSAANSATPFSNVTE